MKAIDMTKIYRDYKGMWVALEGPGSNKVVAFGKNLKKVLKEAKKRDLIYLKWYKCRKKSFL